MYKGHIWVDATVSQTECKGLLINPCLEKAMPMPEQIHILHYDHWHKNISHDCLVFQFGSQYFPTDTLGRMPLSCSKGYVMNDTDKTFVL